MPLSLSPSLSDRRFSPFSPSHSSQPSTSSISSAASLPLYTPSSSQESLAHHYHPNPERTLKTSSVYSDRSYRPLPTLPRSTSMTSLREEPLLRPEVRAPYSPAFDIPSVPQALMGGHSPSSSVHPASPGAFSTDGVLQSPASAVSGRSLRRLPRTPDVAAPRTGFPPGANPDRPPLARGVTTTGHEKSAHRRPLPPSLSRSNTGAPTLLLGMPTPRKGVFDTAPRRSESDTPRRGTFDTTPGPSTPRKNAYGTLPARRASPPVLSLVTELSSLRPLPPPSTTRPRSNSSPATPISSPLSAEPEKSREESQRMSLAKLQRVLSQHVPRELVIRNPDWSDEESTTDESTSGSHLVVDEDERIPMSAIEFAPATPASIKRPALVAKHAEKLRPAWAEEARRLAPAILEPPPEPVTSKEATPMADAFDRQSKRLSRKWVREVKGKRWVEEDYQGVVKQLRLLR
ncbi:hypothetical protein PENSPDRAFT_651383 [Peniophora sp. CONT]|nr:hypothetical protein PENSPDRAFT_651383 [Peniophora sp. CONT]